MFHRGRNRRDLREIISKASNFKERAKFPSRIKTFVSRKFSRITKAISEQKISHVTDGRVCYSWSLSNLSWSLSNLKCQMPWGRAFDWSCSPRGGDIWIFLRPTWRYLTANLDEKDWEWIYVLQFHASRIRRTVCKDLEIMEANENKLKLSGFHCFVFKFCLF